MLPRLATRGRGLTAFRGSGSGSRSRSSASSSSAAPQYISIKSILSEAESTSHLATPEAPAVLQGWIRSCRRQKNISFAVLNDGSNVAGIQAVLSKGLDLGYRCRRSLRTCSPMRDSDANQVCVSFAAASPLVALRDSKVRS